MEKLNLSSRTRRIFAFLIDHFLVCMIVAFAAFSMMGKNWDQADIVTIKKMFVIFPIIFIIYLLKDVFRGTSPGKYILGISIRQQFNSQATPNILNLILRNITLIIWPVEIIILIFDKKRQRLGDMVAKTIVIRNNKIKLKNRLINLFLTIIIIIAVLIINISTIIKKSSAYQIAIDQLSTSKELIDRIGHITNYGNFPTGSIQIKNKFGYAEINIKVYGENSSTSTTVIMKKEPETKWQIENILINE